MPDKSEPKPPVYTCQCGYKDPDRVTFNSHLLHSGKKEPGTHKSLGLRDADTGELVLPPDAERSPDQKAAIVRASEEKRKKRQAEEKVTGDKQVKEAQVTGASKGMIKTNVHTEANLFRMVPRVYEAPLTPIMIGAREAATNEFHWPADMSLGDFLDTWLYFSFKAFGITLNTYTVDEDKLAQFVPGEEILEEEEEDQEEDSEELEEKAGAVNDRA